MAVESGAQRWNDGIEGAEDAEQRDRSTSAVLAAVRCREEGCPGPVDGRSRRRGRLRSRRRRGRSASAAAAGPDHQRGRRTPTGGPSRSRVRSRTRARHGLARELLENTRPSSARPGASTEQGKVIASSSPRADETPLSTLRPPPGGGVSERGRRDAAARRRQPVPDRCPRHRVPGRPVTPSSSRPPCETQRDTVSTVTRRTCWSAIRCCCCWSVVRPGCWWAVRCGRWSGSGPGSTASGPASSPNGCRSRRRGTRSPGWR